MKTQNYKNKMMKVLFGTLAAITVMTSACSKNNGNNNNTAVPPVVVGPGGCTVAGCIPGGVGGQILYSGTTTTPGYAQATFQVYGNPTGTGQGSVTGTIQINNWMCANGMTLAGAYSFTGNANLVGGQFSGNVQMNMPVAQPGYAPMAYVMIDPGSHSGPGLFSISIPTCSTIYGSATQFDLNF